MEKISCNVIQDILPLYVDEVVSEDTKVLIEEHLKNCEVCRRVYEETKTELAVPCESQQPSYEETDLRNFKKFFKKRKIRTVILSVAGTVVFLTAAVTFMNKQVRHIGYKEAGITITQENAEEVYYTTAIKGNYHWKTSLDQDTGIGSICFEQSLWEKYVDSIFAPFDHVHCILKKDEIKEIYRNPDNTTDIIWEASDKEKEAYRAEDHTQVG